MARFTIGNRYGIKRDNDSIRWCRSINGTIYQFILRHGMNPDWTYRNTIVVNKIKPTPNGLVRIIPRRVFKNVTNARNH